MIDGLLKIAEILLGRGDKLRETDADRRKRISGYFYNVSRCLSDIAMALREGKEPFAACEELGTYEMAANPFDWAWRNKESLVVTVYGESWQKSCTRNSSGCCLFGTER
jgi:hypothetical protein